MSRPRLLFYYFLLLSLACLAIGEEAEEGFLLMAETDGFGLEARRVVDMEHGEVADLVTFVMVFHPHAHEEEGHDEEEEGTHEEEEEGHDEEEEEGHDEEEEGGHHEEEEEENPTEVFQEVRLIESTC